MTDLKSGDKVVVLTEALSVYADDIEVPGRTCTSLVPLDSVKPDPTPILSAFVKESPLVAEVGGERDHFEPVGFPGFSTELNIRGYMCRYCAGRAGDHGGAAITFRAEDFRHADSCPWALAKAWMEER